MTLQVGGFEPKISIAILVVAGLTAIACRPRVDGSGKDAQECKASSERVVAATNGPNAIRRSDTPRSRLEAVRDDAANGEKSCERAGMGNDRAMLGAFRKTLDERLASEQPMSPAPAASIGTALDPSSCPKGKVVIDTATGRSVHCTGGARAAATDDYSDIRSRCKLLKDAWMRSDRIDPINECTSDASNHLDIKVVVTTAGWDYLGEHGKRRTFAQSVMDTFRPHWKNFHSWNGSDPAERQVHFWRTSGVDLTIAATISASGFYLE